MLVNKLTNEIIPEVSGKRFVGEGPQRYARSGPRIATIKQHDAQIFKCLQCKSTRMTIGSLDIFSAATNDECYQHSYRNKFMCWDFRGGFVIEESEPADARAWAYNPSFTGHGLRLMMTCTDCGSGSQLCIAGHESITQSWMELIYPRGDAK